MPGVITQARDHIIIHGGKGTGKSYTALMEMERMTGGRYFCSYLKTITEISSLESPCPVFSRDITSPQFGTNGCTDCKYLIYNDLPQASPEPATVKVMDEMECKQRELADNPEFLEVD